MANDLVLALLYFPERTIGDQPALVEHHDAIANAPSAAYVMCDHDQRSVVLRFLLQQEVIYLRRRDAVQAAARLIRKQNLWFQHERTGKPGALPHAPRKLRRNFLLIARQADLAKNLVDDEIHFFLRFACQPKK